MHTLAELKNIVEHAVCDKCRPLYPMLIEPTIIAMLEEYLHDWQGIESVVRELVLENMGTFKTHQMLLLDFGEKPREKLAEFLDLSIYDDFKKTYPRFPHRIQYLRKHDIIGDNLYHLLEELNYRRNSLRQESA
jgi:hypothetical protein